MNTDGYVVIETKLDTTGVDKGLKQIENKDTPEVDIDTLPVEQKIKKINELIEDVSKKLSKEFSNVNIETPEDLLNFVEDLNVDDLPVKGDIEEISNLVQDLTSNLVSLYQEYNELKRSPFKFSDSEKEAEELRKKIMEIVKAIEKLSGKKIIINGINDAKNETENLNKKLKKTISSVVKWGLAIFGVRSAYNFVRQSMSTLSQYNDEMAQKLSNIRLILATALEPVINRIINLAVTLVNYLNYLTKAWFGLDLFARASQLSSEKMSKDLKNSAGYAKEIKKQLAGFDEMNILQDNSASGGGAGGDIDTSKFEFPEVKIPGWLKWIANNKNIILSVMTGVAAGLTAWKLGLKGIQSLGVGIAITGLIYTIQKVIDFLNDPTFNNFIGILEGIAIAVGGVAIAIGAWPVAIGAAIALIVIEIVKHFDWIMDLFNGLLDWIDGDFLNGLKSLFGPLGNILYAPFKVFFEMLKAAFEGLFGGIKKIVQGIIDLFKGNFLEGIKNIFGGLFDILWSPFKTLIAGIAGLWDSVKGFFVDLVDGINDILSKINPINIVANIGGKIWGGIKSIGSGIADFFGFEKGGIVYNNPVKLASGAVINRPGAGVPISGAIGGERGMEGIIPLTDSEQMSLLGESIGKYITVNLTNVTELDGRTIARKVSEVNRNTDFLLNR